MEAEVSSVPTKTTTTLSGSAAPIGWSAYVATFPDEFTPFGFAVCAIITAIFKD